MTGSSLLKKLRMICYILCIIGIILAIIAMSTNMGDTLFKDYMKNIKMPEGIHIDVKMYAGVSLIISSLFTLFDGWLLGRAAKDGRKTMLLIVLLVLGIISPLIEIITAGFNSVLNMESIANIVEILIKVYILNQVLKVRGEALD